MRIHEDRDPQPIFKSLSFNSQNLKTKEKNATRREAKMKKIESQERKAYRSGTAANTPVEIHSQLPETSVGDPDPDVFGPPGSGSISQQRYRSGSFPFLIKVLSELK
jgi:hypothetical protein